LKARVENAGRLLANGQVEDAKAEVEAALKLDSTYQPARELLGQAQAALERARNIAQALRTSKQRMAEGALTEAELQLDKVLEMDPGNPAAREQLKQIREERSRRERRKQRDEVLHRARTFWTISSMKSALSFSYRPEAVSRTIRKLTKLLESARQDQAEQQRQALLTEARNLLSAQRFDGLFAGIGSFPRTISLRFNRQEPSDACTGKAESRKDGISSLQRQGNAARVGQGGKYPEAITHAGSCPRNFLMTSSSPSCLTLPAPNNRNSSKTPPRAVL